jgi:type I restriction enzyme S subunit
LNATPPKTLDDVCEFIVDCLHATAPTQDEGYPLIRTPNIGRGRLILEGVQRVDEHTYQHWTRRAVPQKHDLILAREAPAGNVAIIKNGQTVCLGQRTVHLRPDAAQVDPDFLCYFLLHPKQQGLLLAGETGATSKHVNMRDIRRLPLQGMPGRDVQTRAGALLAAYDDLIENNTRRIKLLEDAARLLYEEWFVRLRFPGNEHTPINDGVPQGWENVPTPEAVDINPKTKLSDATEHWWVEMGDLPLNSMVIQGAVLRGGRSGSKFQNGDTLFARITPCLENGKTAFVDCFPEGVTARGSTEFIVLRSKRLSPEFVYCLARTYAFRHNAIKSMIGASGRQRVQQSCFDKFTVNVPPAVLLTAFTDVVRPIFRQIRALHLQSGKAREARDLLLPRLMSGEVVI